MQPRYDDSLAWLRWLYPKGPWLLTAIEPDRKGIATATFAPDDEGAVREWLEQHGTSRNLYYSVNPPRETMRRKAERNDISAVHYLHVDVDPRAGEDLAAEQQRALDLLRSGHKGLPESTAIVFSGGGYNALWRLGEPIVTNGDAEAIDLATRYNLQIELLLGADSCHNIDRILRLPGTVNRPDARKRRKGRTEALAEVIETHDDRAYPLDRFTPATQVQSGEAGLGAAGSTQTVKVSGNVQRLSSVDELPDTVPDKCKVVIVQGTDPDEPDKHPSRSEWLFWVCCELVRAECDDETIYSVITDPEFRIADSVLEKGSNAETYALRQIGRAREDAIDPHLREMNEKHAIIGDIGGKCRVISEVWDHAMKRTKISRQSFEDVRNRYGRIKVQIGTDNKGNPITQPLGKWWLEHPNARYYESMVFAPAQEVPDAYNLWKGFACEAIPGNCERFLDHVRQVVCGGVEEYYNYLLGWMARTVQQPDSPGQTAVVLRGRMGTGKSFFAKVFGSLFGRHYLQVSDPKHLVGSFNAHLRDCVMLFGDEAFYAGDKKHESVLKTLITEDMLTIEAKGVDAEVAANCIHLIMASNEQWVVPAGLEERRFFVLDVADHRMQDNVYFREVAEEIENGGREALLHYLMTYDLSGFDVRRPPQTRALQEQKLHSLAPEEEWWFNKLWDGRLLAEHDGWQTEVLAEELTTDYIQYTRQFNLAKRGNATRLGYCLRRFCPGDTLERVQKRETVTVRRADGEEKTLQRPYYYLLPDLPALRAYWDEHFGGPYAWPDPGEAEPDTSEPPF